MITVRMPEEIHKAVGDIDNGTFSGRWHFCFENYHDPKFERFGVLRGFNDDTLSPGAVWPMHPDKNNEEVIYCVDGEFQHADDHGDGGVLKKGWVQHTTIGKGMRHAEINKLYDKPMRFIRMWFVPIVSNLEPSLEQRRIDKNDRIDCFYPLVSNLHRHALPIQSDAEVFACFLKKNKVVHYSLTESRGAYIYVLDGGPVFINDDYFVPTFGAAMVSKIKKISVKAAHDADILLIDANLSH